MQSVLQYLEDYLITWGMITVFLISMQVAEESIQHNYGLHKHKPI